MGLLFTKHVGKEYKAAASRLCHVGFLIHELKGCLICTYCPVHQVLAEIVPEPLVGSACVGQCALIDPGSLHHMAPVDKSLVEFRLVHADSKDIGGTHGLTHLPGFGHARSQSRAGCVTAADNNRGISGNPHRIRSGWISPPTTSVEA